MAAVLHKPWLDPTAAVLRAAFDRSTVSRTKAGSALKITGGIVSNMIHAKRIVSSTEAQILGQLLGIDPASIVSPPPPPGANPQLGRPRKGARPKAETKTKAKMGPAQRAVVALLEHKAKPPPAAVTVLPKATPVLGMEAMSDGSATVWCKASLPHQQAAALFRLLLDFGLTDTTESK